MFNIKEPEYRNEELYTRTFYPDLCEPEVEEPKVESDLRCKFCGGKKELFGLPDGTVCCDMCMTDLEGETEWEGRTGWNLER